MRRRSERSPLVSRAGLLDTRCTHRVSFYMPATLVSMATAGATLDYSCWVHCTSCVVQKGPAHWATRALLNPN